jgi:hypothetical protein
MTKVVFPLSVSIVFCATMSVCLQSLSSLLFVLVLRAGSEFARVGSSLLSVRFYVCLGYAAVRSITSLFVVVFFSGRVQLMLWWRG